MEINFGNICLHLASAASVCNLPCTACAICLAQSAVCSVCAARAICLVQYVQFVQFTLHNMYTVQFVQYVQCSVCSVSALQCELFSLYTSRFNTCLDSCKVISSPVKWDQMQYLCPINFIFDVKSKIANLYPINVNIIILADM